MARALLWIVIRLIMLCVQRVQSPSWQNASSALILRNPLFHMYYNDTTTLVTPRSIAAPLENSGGAAHGSYPEGRDSTSFLRERRRCGPWQLPCVSPEGDS
ncbi:hypothetical protein HWV62_38360 [Athelia sp. TMB]|nr:hypothetical protein HWV62_38360 [Athelia sp. TMB]